ncbi:MAG: hypothetical protein WDZ74_02085, partial [Candidatus Paceibacterota bacterium]
MQKLKKMLEVLSVAVFSVTAGLILFSSPEFATASIEVVDRSSTPSRVTKLELGITHNNGTYTINGDLTQPNPCYRLGYLPIVRHDGVDYVELRFTTIPPQSGTVCAQVVRNVQFTKTFKATPDAKIRVTLDGREIPFRFVDGGSDRTVDVPRDPDVPTVDVPRDRPSTTPSRVTKLELGITHNNGT